MGEEFQEEDFEISFNVETIRYSQLTNRDRGLFDAAREKGFKEGLNRVASNNLVQIFGAILFGAVLGYMLGIVW
jgi:hypothetical protein